MKKIGILQLGLSFAGCFLGAGYVSGQELWQFFGSFGAWGIVGLILAILLLSAVGVIMLRLNRLTGFDEADKLIAGEGHPPLRYAVTLLSMLLLFGIGTIMTAGAGALAAQLFGLPAWCGSLIFAATVAVVSLAGLSGMVSVFSATVPLLAAFSLAFGLYALRVYGFAPQTVSGSNPLMSSWAIAAVSFACYNLFAGIAVVAPLGRHVKGTPHIIGGVALGASLLLVTAGSVLVCVSAAPRFSAAELPMLSFAADISPLFGTVYGVLLLLAMFGTALSATVALTNALHIKLSARLRRKAPIVICTVLLMFCGSLFGFGELIGLIYPIFGYCSSVFIVLLIVHYFKRKRQSLKA